MDIRSFFSDRKRKRPENSEESEPLRKRRKQLFPKVDSDSDHNLDCHSAKERKDGIVGGATRSSECEEKCDEAKARSEGESEAEFEPVSEEEMEMEGEVDEEDTSQHSSVRRAVTALSRVKLCGEDATKLKNRFRRSTHDPVTDAGFDAETPMPYLVVAEAFEKMSQTTKRLEKVDVMANLFRSVMVLRPQELLQVVYLCCNEFAPPYEGLELGIGDQVILKSLCESTGRNLKDIKKDLHRIGDLGLVAVQSRARQKTMFKPKPLTVQHVFETFIRVAKTQGRQSMQEKVRHIQRMFVASRGQEAKFIVRHLQGKMRMGVNEQTVLAAIGRACAFTSTLCDPPVMNRSESLDPARMMHLEDTYVAIMKQAICELPNYELVIPALIQHGIEELPRHCHLTPGVPIKVMLAKPTKGVEEILERFKGLKFTLEYKYDGERAQIHILADGTVRVFSRNAEDNTEKFPDLVANVHKYMKEGVSSAILDSEVVAFDRKEKKILPFQTLTTRKRKGVKEEELEVQVCIYAFDLLYLNGESLLSQQFSMRREKLRNSFEPREGEFAFAHHKDSENPEEIQEFLDEAVNNACEGLMVKTLDEEATYEPSKRSHNWLKCKKDYLEGVGDTLDLVVMGAFHGQGKRTGVFGSYLLGCYDEESDSIQSVCKCATGFSDEDLAKLTTLLKESVTDGQKPIDYETGMECEVWFHPKCVFEVKCADLSISPVHKGGCGIVHEEKGIGLRFPRYLGLREDKNAYSATTSCQVVEFYRKQPQLAA